MAVRSCRAEGIPPFETDMASMQAGYPARQSANSRADILSTAGTTELPIEGIFASCFAMMAWWWRWQPGKFLGGTTEKTTTVTVMRRTATGSCAAKTVEFTTRLNGASKGPGRCETCAASENGRPGSHPGLVYGGIGWCRGGVVVFWLRRRPLFKVERSGTDGYTPALAYLLAQHMGETHAKVITGRVEA